jgi:hypothetical protein
MKADNFDKDKLNRLEQAYKFAHENKLESFWFDGQEYLTSYAKYVIEYLKCKLK